MKFCMINKLLLTLYRSITYSALITGKTTYKTEWFRCEGKWEKRSMFLAQFVTACFSLFLNFKCTIEADVNGNLFFLFVPQG